MTPDWPDSSAMHAAEPCHDPCPDRSCGHWAEDSPIRCQPALISSAAFSAIVCHDGCLWDCCTVKDCMGAHGPACGPDSRACDFCREPEATR